MLRSLSQKSTLIPLSWPVESCSIWAEVQPSNGAMELAALTAHVDCAIAAPETRTFQSGTRSA
jgi:hypothetical protein